MVTRQLSQHPVLSRKLLRVSASVIVPNGMTVSPGGHSDTEE
jgi:hypothetical protein